MTDSRAAVGFDRLPWLVEDSKPAPASAKRRAVDFAGWAVAAMLLVAGLSYWLGTRTALIEEPERTAVGRLGSVAVPLPAPRAPNQVTSPEAAPVPTPTIEIPRRTRERPPARKRPAPAERQQTSETTSEGKTAEAAKPVVAPTVPVKARPIARPQPLTLWPARTSQGASGRLVQIGAFGTRLQAKRGWWHMVRAYPGVRRLPAVVVEARNSRHRPFYRFQIGTTSQAHSEVLCQRMERIRFSCAVVGLPGARKAVER
jgi:hypothetical protein